MKQQVMKRPGEITFQEVPVPPMGPNQLTLKMEKIGVCGSDIHVWHGKHPYTSYPVTQGHEVSARVVKVGAEVTGFAEGFGFCAGVGVATGTGVTGTVWYAIPCALAMPRAMPSAVASAASDAIMRVRVRLAATFFAAAARLAEVAVRAARRKVPSICSSQLRSSTIISVVSRSAQSSM